MVEKPSGAGVEALFDSGQQIKGADGSEDGAAFGDILLTQGQGGAGHRQSGQAGQSGDDAVRLGQGLLAQGDRLVDEGMELLGRGQRAAGMRLLHEGAERQRRGTLLLAQSGKDKTESGQPAGPQAKSGQVERMADGSLPLQYTSLAIHNSRELRSPREDGTVVLPSAKVTGAAAVQPELAVSSDAGGGTEQFFDARATSGGLATTGDTPAAEAERPGPFSYQFDHERYHVLDGMLGGRVFTSGDYGAAAGYGFEKKLTYELALIVQPGTRVFVFVNEARREVVVNAVGGAKYNHKKFSVTTVHNHEKEIADMASGTYDRHVVSVTFDFSKKFKP